jgi:hypothetical protein
MSDKTVSVNFGGVFSPLLSVLFIGLKLTGYINWPWLWVLSPIWIPIAIVIAFVAIWTVLYLVVNLTGKR